MPKLLTSRGDYGLLLMVDLAKSFGKEPKSLSEIATFYHLPQSFLEQIALDLRRGHLLAARRGKAGGYFLNRRPEMISVIEVLEALEGPLQVVSCQGGGCPAFPNCLTQEFWQVFQRHLHRTLRGITLADLVANRPHELLSLTNGEKNLRGAQKG